MSLLLLKEIGKIYASEAAIAVGIRGVNLSFDKGEFVAVTGKSGSGKSTLLNVISGMDTYEEGEMFIEGEPTSHYQQSDWEEYRHKYISFVFQDYNIIDSFTVLENVELALMYIEDAKERRKKAVELLTRVGMEKFLRQRGSKLSGGQKQRTVIARALAKDSPIILADEPTGNLDSATAKEIIKLLYEVSRDKLLIIVTHSFDQVEEYATRQIRIYDGGVEFDHEENADKEKGEQNPDKCGYNTVNDEKTVGEPAEKKKKSRFMVRVQNGFILGFAIFKAMPRLTVFMSLMMILGAIGIFISTTVFGTGRLYDSTPYMFVPYEGRVIIVKQTGEIPTSEELSEWTNGSKEISAKSLLRCDYLLDSGISVQFENAQNGLRSNLYIIATFNEDFGKNVIGRYPSAEDEALLYLPIYMQPYFGKEADKIIKVSNISYPVTVVGIKYYYDNNLSPKILFTEEGFETHTAIAFAISSQLSLNFSVNVGGEVKPLTLSNVYPYYSEEKKVSLKKAISKLYPNEEATVTTPGTFTFTRSRADGLGVNQYDAVIPASSADVTNNVPSENVEYDAAYVSTALIKEWMRGAIEETYTQASLIFDSDREAHAAIKVLNKNGYIAVASDAVNENDSFTAVLSAILSVYMGGIWIGLIAFFAFFISLLTNRSMTAFKSDMAIMRSMGITMGDIRFATYVRVLMTVIPAIPMVALVAFLIYTTPFLNQFFTYLYFWQYALIFAGIILMAIFVTRIQLRRLFRKSVKKSIRKGEAA